MRTGAGNRFDNVSIKWARYSGKIKSLQERLLDKGWLAVKQVSTRFGSGWRIGYAFRERLLWGRIVIRM